MLSRLLVRNYAIISELDIQFNNGLTIITGETGAGKSILIGALSLVLGKRADSSSLFNLDEKCVIEAHFDVSGKNVEAFFVEHDLDYEATAILRRELTTSGKSRAFINDTPVNLRQLRELASVLIDIHSQHEILSLKTTEFRSRFLDSCVDGGKTFESYTKKYQEWGSLKRTANQLKEQLNQATADQDYLQFQLDELAELNLTEGELIEGQARLTILENAEEIQKTLSNISSQLSSNESPLNALYRLEGELKEISRKYEKANDWSERIRSVAIELDDIAQEIQNDDFSENHNTQELEELQDRVDEILRLMTKHRKQSENELIEFRTKLEDKLSGIGSSDEKLTLVLADLEKAGAELEKLANRLSDSRRKVAKTIGPNISKELKQMGMPEAALDIQISQEEITSLGQDRIEIQFTANRGQAPQDISKIASGGELSRLMLAVKSEMAKTARLPSIIFDEIDTGVSGDVANRVGNKIQTLGERMQVFCITHLPQIAAKASSHLYVFKELVGGKTSTQIKQLNSQERIVEIAKMLSNANPTEEALAHAKNLVSENE